MLALIRQAIGRHIIRLLLLDPIRILLAATGPSTLNQLTNHTGVRRTMVKTSLEVFAERGWLDEDPFHPGRYRVNDHGRAGFALVLQELAR